ncbi:N-acetyldiaminopimelate deacetylase [Raoultella terrigena]|uniref:N-acetyldiaminopimelate deacetylase n=1 Tax=Raoultella terrigena TaxID=577 RepID=A0A4U9CSD9_RAOTE|nr:N-acetyldiaminopimelate deacetylase [Raoultella terrigena]
MSRGCRLGSSPPAAGAFYANVDRFVFKVTGKGAHAARPHEGKDAILLASQLVTLLQSVASREVNTLDSVVLSVTRIQGGNTWNVPAGERGAGRNAAYPQQRSASSG